MNLNEPLRQLQLFHARQLHLQPRRAPSIVAASGPSETTVYLYEAFAPEGAPGISSKAIAAALAQTKARTLRVRINSPGGSVFEAKAIYQLLREHRARKVVHVDGLAASAASFVAMAGDLIVTAPEATWFIHGAQAITAGGARELRATADLLDRETAAILAIYVRRTKQKPEDLRAWVDAETFMDAQTAKARGFTDAIAGEGAPTARLAFDGKTRSERERLIRLAKLGIHRRPL